MKAYILDVVRTYERQKWKSDKMEAPILYLKKKKVWCSKGKLSMGPSPIFYVYTSIYRCIFEKKWLLKVKALAN